MRILPILLLLTGPVAAQHIHHPQADQGRPEIAALTAAQRADIEAGRGAGLALPAEANGYPGPMHVLEHATALGLSPSQHAAIEALMQPMRRAAIDAGARLMDAERRLDALFVGAVATPDAVRQAATAAGLAHAEMRMAHLLAHIAARALLSPEQLSRYAVLRGHRPG